MVMSYLLRSLSPTIYKSIVFLTTAREIWKDLEERFSVTSGPQFYGLQQSLNEVSQGDTNITDFCIKIKMIWDELSSEKPVSICVCTGCTCNVSQKFLQEKEEQRLVQLLMKLHKKHSQVRTNILMTNPLPSITTAYKLLVQDEQNKKCLKFKKPHHWSLTLCCC